MTAKGDYFPTRINEYVPNMQYAADVRYGGMGTIVIPACAATSATAIAAAATANATAGTELLAASYTIDAKFGRNVIMAASGATGSSAVFRVRGKDYLGQPMCEDIAVANADGTTTKAGVKAFKTVTSVKATTAAANAVTLAIGFGNVLGLPYSSLKLISELVSKVVPTAGTFVAGVSPATVQTVTTADPRGTYTPQASFLPNGTREYELTFMHDYDSLHGNRHFYV